MKNNVVVYRISDDGHIETLCIYSGLSPKVALICAIHQFVLQNMNTWTYPDDMPGIVRTRNGYSYFFGTNSVLVAKEEAG